MTFSVLLLQLQPAPDMCNGDIAGSNRAISKSPGKCKRHKDVHSPSASHKRRHSKSPKTRSLRCLPTFTHNQCSFNFVFLQGAVCGSLCCRF